MAASSVAGNSGEGVPDCGVGGRTASRASETSVRRSAAPAKALAHFVIADKSITRC